jgi:hypothetical protein
MGGHLPAPPMNRRRRSPSPSLGPLASSMVSGLGGLTPPYPRHTMCNLDKKIVSAIY